MLKMYIGRIRANLGLWLVWTTSWLGQQEVVVLTRYLERGRLVRHTGLSVAKLLIIWLGSSSIDRLNGSQKGPHCWFGPLHLDTAGFVIYKYLCRLVIFSNSIARRRRESIRIGWLAGSAIIARATTINHIWFISWLCGPLQTAIQIFECQKKTSFFKVRYGKVRNQAGKFALLASKNDCDKATKVVGWFLFSFVLFFHLPPQIQLLLLSVSVARSLVRMMTSKNMILLCTEL